MKASELRIGNLVNDGLSVICINDLQRHRIWLHDFMSKPFGVDEEDLKPIPITEEWLLKFGAEKWNDGYHLWRTVFVCFDTLKHLSFYFGGDEADNYLTTIQYVHQLQNLYFALTGNELELK